MAGQFVGATRDDALLEEVLKCLFCKLYVEVGAAEEISAGADSFERARHLRSVFARVRGDFPDLFEPDTEILLDPEAIRFVLAECAFSLIDAESDPIGDAFEVFVGSESRGRAGQFFTPRVVTDLLVEAVDPKPGELVIDPACGAGGFLTSVARHYVARGTDAKNLSSLVSRDFFGIDKDEYLVKLARLHVSLLSGGHPHIACADSIALQDGSRAFGEHFPKEGFDVLLTNPPFGTRIVAAKPEVLRTFELARKWRYDKASDTWGPTSEMQAQVPPQVLFVERCLSLLKPGGRLGMVLPESVLSNKSYRYVTEYLLAKADVQAVMGMPEALFKTSGKGGTHTKTCLLVAVKNGGGRQRGNSVFMAEAKWCGHDSRARTIPKNDLPAIAGNLKAARTGNTLKPSSRGFLIGKSEISNNVLCPRYYDPQVDADLNALKATHDLLLFGDLVSSGTFAVATGDELGKLAYGTGDIPFVRTSDISNWEIKADAKHSVDRKIYESFRKKQDVRPLDILMVKDGTYLIGTCAVVTEEDREIVYQSHIYKIRVQANQLGLTPFLLIAVLSSPIVQRQIRSKQFTQDIIDSLGERIRELVLPIPRASDARERIDAAVRQAVQKRIEARALMKQAKQAVTEISNLLQTQPLAS
ncbi:MAG: N-6 DNA methylase [Gemmatimonadaceae bacterium]